MTHCSSLNKVYKESLVVSLVLLMSISDRHLSVNISNTVQFGQEEITKNPRQYSFQLIKSINDIVCLFKFMIRLSFQFNYK